jgi:AcrR family transcriptional regulator
MRERRRQHRLAEIMQAGFEEFAQRGYAATRLEAVGQRVSLARGAIYLYFQRQGRTVQSRHTQRYSARAPAGSERNRELWRLQRRTARSLLMTFYGEIARDRRRSLLLRVLVAEGLNFPELTEFITTKSSNTE